MRRANLVGIGVLGFFVLLLVAAVLRNGLSLGGNPLGDSPNENVVERVKDQHRHDPWMKHVTDWGTRRNIRVETDYPPDSEASWLAAYEICTAIKHAYAKDANDLPGLRIYGTDPNVSIKVDGSKGRDPRSVQLATSVTSHDYRCGITPPQDAYDRARKLGLPVYPY